MYKQFAYIHFIFSISISVSLFCCIQHTYTHDFSPNAFVFFDVLHLFSVFMFSLYYSFYGFVQSFYKRFKLVPRSTLSPMNNYYHYYLTFDHHDRDIITDYGLQTWEMNWRHFGCYKWIKVQVYIHFGLLRGKYRSIQFHKDGHFCICAHSSISGLTLLGVLCYVMLSYI